MSDNLPYSGVEMVAVIRYAVVTQACTESPCRSSPMVRMADVTMVWSSAARNMPSISPPRISRICRWLSCDDDAAPAGTEVGGGVPRAGAATALLLIADSFVDAMGTTH